MKNKIIQISESVIFLILLILITWFVLITNLGF
jgi:hypothetical protein